jgi:hypothetical protein
MPECPICRRTYDGSFQAFVPPHAEAFDTVACARRAAETLRSSEVTAPSLAVLPVIEIVTPRSKARAAPAPRRRSPAALGLLAVPPAQAALAAGVGLVAAGAASSIYLWVTWPYANQSPIASGVPQPGPGHEATGPPALNPGPALPRPSPGKGTAPPASRTAPPPTNGPPPRPATSPAPTRPPQAAPGSGAARTVRPGSTSAAEAQYGLFRPPSPPGTHRNPAGLSP